MSEFEVEAVEAADADAQAAPRRKGWPRWAKWGLGILIAPFLIVLLAYGFLASPIGKRYIADQISGFQTETGLSVTIGRIEGDLFGKARLYDIEVNDPKGTFMTIPEASLDWRPVSWINNGLDIRELVARRGRLQRLPELNPGDPDAPILPNFDIRIDRLVIDNFTIAPGVATERAQRVDMVAKADIRSGRAMVQAQGQLGREDRFSLLLDSEPDRDKFDVALDLNAPADGVIAGIAGLTDGYEAKVKGDGSYSNWLGHALVQRLPRDGEDEKERLAAFQLANNKGEYSVIGQIYPGLDASSILGRVSGEKVSLVAKGTFEDNTFDGNLRAVMAGLDASGEGAIDLGENRFDAFNLAARLRDPEAFADGVRFENASVQGVLNGTFGDLTLAHELNVDRIEAGMLEVVGIAQRGTASYDGTTFTVPLSGTVAQIVTGSEYADPSLKNGTISGQLTYQGSRLAIEGGNAQFPDASAEFTLRGDTSTGAYGVAGPVRLRGIDVGGFGRLSGDAAIIARFGSVPWSVNARMGGQLREVANQTVADLAGNTLDFSGSLEVSANSPINLRNVVLDSERLSARFNSRVVPGSGGTRTTLAGTGRHVEYGPFTFDAEISGAGPRATLVFADPYPSADLKDVRVTIAPSEEGFAIDVEGQSLLGRFDGNLGLELPPNAPTRIDISRLVVSDTGVTGTLTLQDSGLNGTLDVAGGGLDGTLSLQPEGAAQAFDIQLKANGATFGGTTPITIGNADIFANGSFGGGPTKIYADVSGSRLSYGDLTIAQFAAKAAIEDGVGTARGTIAGRRSDRFTLKFDADINKARTAVLARGSYGGRAITMPRRAVLTPREDGGYDLAPTQIGYARGYTIVEGQIGGSITDLDLKFANMPLALADILGSELGLGGRVSGVANYRVGANGLPTADAQLKIDNFTRSGLVLSSRPVDISTVIRLGTQQLNAAAVLTDDGRKVGRVDARIALLGSGENLTDRIRRGQLNAKVLYNGAAEALWRLMAIETFDLTGRLVVNARALGTLANPRLDGSLASDNLRLQSAVSGTDITGIKARGTFARSRLNLTSFSGNARGGGTITGSGTIDLANISAERGPSIDLRAAVNNAYVLNAAGLDATLTGPLRIVSNGVGGTIAGRVRINRASWSLGVAEDDLRLPTIRTREINRRDGAEEERYANTGEWRYAITAKSPGGISVEGMGLDSLWGVDIVLTGTVNEPRLSGRAFLDRGTYSFAGARFELSRGRITFNGNEPINPQLDIGAETNRNGTSVEVSITGRAQSPNIALSSTPSLPDEEILAQLLFGGSVTNLSPTDGAQLAAALASLRGGGGVDPIGQLRDSIGLDQLRIVAADPVTGRKTGVAVGKYLGNRIYVELITDGQGYSATRIEYQITSWLTLLGQVSTIGRDSVLAEISHDY